ncbi:MAG TPA: hypothetical protein VK783_00135, partial [Bacteroidia bacterium]|nr:hypothetical protein [Bacteroidia bacterium]
MKNRKTHIGINRLAWANFFVLALFLSMGTIHSLSAQNIAIDSNGSAPNKYAVLDLSSNVAGGFLLPTLTSTQITALTAPPSGTLIFNSSTTCMQVYFQGYGWENVICPCSVAPTTPTISGPTTLVASSTGNTFSASGTGASSYSWSVPAGVGTIIGSSTGSSITVTANGTGGGPFNITVTAINNCGTATSASYAVTVSGGCVHSSQTFNYTGGSQTWTVPACITTVTVSVSGAQGGQGEYHTSGTTYTNSGGLGGTVVATITGLTGGTSVLTIIVGGQGGNGAYSSCTYGSGGYGGGGAGYAYCSANCVGGGGGGYSKVSVNAAVVIAGGGGGGGADYPNNNYEKGGPGGAASAAAGTGYADNTQGWVYDGYVLPGGGANGATGGSGGSDAGNGYCSASSGSSLLGSSDC